MSIQRFVACDVVKNSLSKLLRVQERKKDRERFALHPNCSKPWKASSISVMSSFVLTDEKSAPVLADPEQIIPVLSDAEKTAYEMLSWLFVDTELMPTYVKI